MSSHCLTGRAQYFDDFVLPLGALLIDWCRNLSPALATIGAQKANPSAMRYVLKADTKCVVPSVAFVAEHHFVLIVRLSAVNTCLTIHALPPIETNGVNHFICKLKTRGMSAVITIRAVKEILLFEGFAYFADGVQFSLSDQLWRTAVFTLRAVVVVDIFGDIRTTTARTLVV